jgi:hypothetical protein
MIQMEEKKNQNPLSFLDIHIAVDRAARFHATFAAPVYLQNTLPPLRSNDLLAALFSHGLIMRGDPTSPG